MLISVCYVCKGEGCTLLWHNDTFNYVYLVYCYTDDRETLILNQTLIQDKFTGDYNVTVYWSLRRDDPLLIASLLSFMVSVKVGLI